MFHYDDDEIIIILLMLSRRREGKKYVECLERTETCIVDFTVNVILNV